MRLPNVLEVPPIPRHSHAVFGTGADLPRDNHNNNKRTTGADLPTVKCMAGSPDIIHAMPKEIIAPQFKCLCVRAVVERPCDERMRWAGGTLEDTAATRKPTRALTTGWPAQSVSHG